MEDVEVDGASNTMLEHVGDKFTPFTPSVCLRTVGARDDGSEPGLMSYTVVFAQRSVTAYSSQTRTKCQRMRRSDLMCLVLWRILAYVLHATPTH